MAKIPVVPMGGGAPVWGTYVGDGAARRTIPLGFTPRFLSIWDYVGRQGYDVRDSTGGFTALGGGVATEDHPDHVAYKIVDGGFLVRYSRDGAWATNTPTQRYTYLAFH